MKQQRCSKKVTLISATVLLTTILFAALNVGYMDPPWIIVPHPEPPANGPYTIVDRRLSWPMARNGINSNGHTNSRVPTEPVEAWSKYLFRSFCNPVVGCGKVFVRSEDYTGSMSHVYAFNAFASSRQESWPSPAHVPQVLIPYTDLTQGNMALDTSTERLYVGSNVDGFYCLDANSGAELWHNTDYTMNPDCIPIVSGAVYFTSGNRVIALDASPTSDGGLVGIYSGLDPQGWMYGLAVDYDADPSGRVFVVERGYNADEGYLTCLDPLLSIVLWQYPDVKFNTAPVIENGIVYIGAYVDVYEPGYDPVPHGFIYAFDEYFNICPGWPIDIWIDREPRELAVEKGVVFAGVHHHYDPFDPYYVYEYIYAVKPGENIRIFGDPENNYPCLSAPVLADGKLLVISKSYANNYYINKISCYYDSGNEYTKVWDFDLALGPGQLEDGLSLAVANNFIFTGGTMDFYAIKDRFMLIPTLNVQMHSILEVGKPYFWGYSLTNPGDPISMLNITLEAVPAIRNETVFAYGIQNITVLDLGTNETAAIACAWYSSGWSYGRYMMGMEMAATYLNGTESYFYIMPVDVTLSVRGDTTGDGSVNVLDLILIANHLGHVELDGHVPYSPDWYKCMNTDLNDDGKHNVLDLIVCAVNLGQHW